MDNIHLITAGGVVHNTAYLLNTEVMDKFLESLRQRYDVIIIDSSPIMAVSDTSIIAPKTDGLILVYRAGVTSRVILHRAKVQIESFKEKGILKGIVLNNTTPEVRQNTYYYYHYARSYYTEDAKAKL